ncbi:TonB-dependent receptor [Flavicella marina]|uniref:TonB-dependent receptor n=1 Tax=Flavicella marina TaxID=1475951 RepID=UPI001264206C|nr:TonB-dependent receptor [Flavicella marina]
MKRFIVISCLLMLSISGSSQTNIDGFVLNQNKEPIIGANVYLKGTYSGGMTDDTGHFEFATQSKGKQTLVVSYVSFETKELVLDVSKMLSLEVKLKEDVNSLDAVVIAAGTFSSGDNSKVATLKPLDVVTTASALGDPIAAFQTMPGTSTVAEDGRLFVRGGEADETQIFIDGIRVFTPYLATANNTPTRGRYSPFLFEGMTFSTGGYSAEYGQALSGVLLLNTINEPEQEKTDVGIMSVGATVGNTQIWNKKSLSVNVSYLNLAPYNSIFYDRNEWIKPYEALSGETVYRHVFKNGLLKLYTAFDASRLEVVQEDINFSEGLRYGLQNDNFYFNGSYKGILTENWSIMTGLSYTYADTKVDYQLSDITDKENSLHAKVKFKRFFSNRFQFSLGAEYFTTNFEEDFLDENIPSYIVGFQKNIVASYAEFDLFFSKNLALKAGLRGEYSDLEKRASLSPRASLAYKVSKFGQVSFAYGDFLQAASNTYLKFNNKLSSAQTQHYIFNYQFNKNGRILRAELYAKNYDDLIKYDTELPYHGSYYSTEGYGFANGLDVFWRDNTTIKNTDYWLSYSYLDSKRDFKNYENEAQPNFVNTHNFSVVVKHWIEDWKSQIGLSYTYASGRTYTDPNKTGFLNQKTTPYGSLSMNWAYLLTQQKILYLSVNNVLGRQNINGYQYANTPNGPGVFESRPLLPAADSFFFVGFFWTISEKGTDNQLDNL